MQYLEFKGRDRSLSVSSTRTGEDSHEKTGGKGRSITLILCVFPIGQLIEGEHGVVLATPGNLWTQKTGTE